MSTMTAVKAILEGRVVDMFHRGMTAKEVAAFHGCSVQPIKRIWKAHGLRRPAKRRPGVGSGSGNPQWRGGRRIRPDGYVMVWTPEGERLEHRVVMETILGRALADDEIVHHRDGVKSNNLPVNLCVMTQSDHAKHHNPDMHAARYGR